MEARLSELFDGRTHLRRRRDDLERTAAAAAFCVAYLPGCYALAHGRSPVLQLRDALVFYAPCLLALAWLLSRLAPLDRRRGVAALGAVLLLGAVSYHDYVQSPTPVWRASAQSVLGHHIPGDSIYVLDGDLESARNLAFYRFYFERLGAAEHARLLQPLPLESDALISQLLFSSATAAFVLAPNDSRIAADALSTLRGLGFTVTETTWPRTRVYRVAAPNL